MKRIAAFMRAALAACVAFALCVPAAHAQRTLSLEECAQFALRGNAETVTAALETEAARQARKTALTKYFPRVDAGAMFFRAQKELFELQTSGGNLPVYDGNPAHIPLATQFAYLPPSDIAMLRSGAIGYVDVVQPIFAGGRIVNANRLAALGVDVRELQQRLAEHETRIRTEERYWAVITLNSKSATLDSYERMLAALEHQVGDAVRAGLALRNDLLKVQLQRSDLESKRSQLENAKALATMSLCQHIGITYDQALVLTDTLPAVENPLIYRVDHAAALPLRPEYQLLEQAVEAEGLQKRIALGEYLPSLAVGVTGRYIELDESEGRTIGAVFGTLSVPLSDWWGGSHAIETHALREDIARTRMKDGAEQLMLQMEKAWLDLTDAYRQTRVRETARLQAEEQLRVNRESYAQGISTLSDLLDAQAALQRSEDQRIESRANYRTLFVRYLLCTER